LANQGFVVSSAARNLRRRRFLLAALVEMTIDAALVEMTIDAALVEMTIDAALVEMTIDAALVEMTKSKTRRFRRGLIG